MTPRINLGIPMTLPVVDNKYHTGEMEETESIAHSPTYHSDPQKKSYLARLKMKIYLSVKRITRELIVALEGVSISLVHD